VSRFICTECLHPFPESQAIIQPYCGTFEYECPRCLSPHIEEYADEIPVLREIKVRPVSTENLERFAREVKGERN
jgi:hypothetical protein